MTSLLSGAERRRRVQFMQAWIYSPLQRIASDSGTEGGREGGSEAHRGGWKSGVRRKEQALLGDHQTGCLMKAYLRRVFELS